MRRPTLRTLVLLTAALITWAAVLHLAIADRSDGRPIATEQAQQRTERRAKYGPRHRVLVSWYQDTSKACPGYYGPHVWGVAHRTLRCGTRLKLSYHGRTVYTRVIDRGPYVSGRTLDLHAPVARALAFSGVDYVSMQVHR